MKMKLENEESWFLKEVIHHCITSKILLVTWVDVPPLIKSLQIASIKLPTSNMDTIPRLLFHEESVRQRHQY